MKKLFLLSLFLVGGISCNKRLGSCPDVNEYFDIQDLKITNGRRTPFRVESIGTENPIEFEAHVILLDFNVLYHSVTHQPINFINYVYALDCIVEGSRGTNEQLKSIIVTTNFDIDQQHLTNDTINDIVLYDEMNLSQLLNVNEIELRQEGFILSLSNQPELSDSISLNVDFSLTNGERYLVTSEPIKIL